jgi:hypothetical protein
MRSVLFPQKIIDCLYRIEGDNGDFNEKGNPSGHGTIPQTRQFLRFQGTAMA